MGEASRSSSTARLCLSTANDVKKEDLEEDPEFCKVIASFKYVKCNFKKLQKAEDYIYESLSLLTFSN